MHSKTYMKVCAGTRGHARSQARCMHRAILTCTTYVRFASLRHSRSVSTFSSAIDVPPTMPQPAATMHRPDLPPVTGGITVGGAPPTAGRKRKHGQRGTDHVEKRAERVCMLHGHEREDALKCKGRAARGKCQYQCTLCRQFESCTCK